MSNIDWMEQLKQLQSNKDTTPAPHKAPQKSAVTLPEKTLNQVYAAALTQFENQHNQELDDKAEQMAIGEAEWLEAQDCLTRDESREALFCSFRVQGDQVEPLVSDTASELDSDSVIHVHVHMAAPLLGKKQKLRVFREADLEELITCRVSKALNNQLSGMIKKKIDMHANTLWRSTMDKINRDMEDIIESNVKTELKNIVNQLKNKSNAV